MPITTHAEEAVRYGDDEHWVHLMEHLFVPAIEAAGYAAVPPITQGSAMIHAEIVRNLETADMVLCDLSGHNPNVFFELGVRTSLDKPIAIVRDDKTTIPFDLGGLNAHPYSSDLRKWSIEASLPLLQNHIEQATLTCDGRNPMWQQYGLTVRAQAPAVEESPMEAKLDLLLGQFNQIVHRQDRLENELADSRWPSADQKYNLGSGPVFTDEVTRNFAKAVANRFSQMNLEGRIVRSRKDNVDFEIHSLSDPGNGFKNELTSLARAQGLRVEFVSSS